MTVGEFFWSEPLDSILEQGVVAIVARCHAAIEDVEDIDVLEDTAAESRALP